MTKIEKQNVAAPGQTPVWQLAKITRYNYAYRPNYDPALLDPRLTNGEPIGGSTTGLSSYNSYRSGGAGQDRLLSYTEYLFDGNGQPVQDQPAIYTVYDYEGEPGLMSKRSSWDGRTRTLTETNFTYDRERVQSVMVDEVTWPEDPEQGPDWELDRERLLEAYAYNIFGERIGVLHCTAQSGGAHAYPDTDSMYPCWKQVRMFDYVDGKLLVERESKIQGRPQKR
ncbi:MAG TPA: hypothetical protein VMV94_12795, partial [Phycisphaerae bacterium]|nr:hypothetical protein [Phycisphaerae bacterium]